MTIAFLGTSNCITHGSFVPHAGKALGEAVQNLSIGASSSAVGLYFLDRLKVAKGDPVVLDYVINDSGYIGAGLKDAETIKRYLAAIVARVREQGGTPILLIDPSYAGFNGPSIGEQVHLEFCRAQSVHFLNLAGLFRDAAAGGVTREAMMRDESHMSANVTPLVGEWLANAARRLRGAPMERRASAGPVMQIRTIKAQSIAEPGKLIEHASSFYKAPFLVVRDGETLKIDVASDEVLIGLMMNTGALGANVSFASDGIEIVKPMTIYWDRARPDWFTSILVDFVKPLPGSADGITMRIVPPDVPLTERTLHHQPTLPGRYGEIEIEGFLVGQVEKSSSVTFDQPVGIDLDLLAAFGRSRCLHDLVSAAAIPA